MKQTTIAAIRFGYGLGAGRLAGSAPDIMQSLRAADAMVSAYPLLSLAEALALRRNYFKTQDAEASGDPEAVKAHEAARLAVADTSPILLRHVVARAVASPAPFRERLHLFWLDHFTTRIRGGGETALAHSFADTALRATMTRRFADMLRAVVVHPQMLLYLDQTSSVGPGSVAGRRQNRGLNENLARELLELHTLGVGGSYSQGDVMEMAELLTGLQFRPKDGGFAFVANHAEPGPETVLGRTYGGMRRGGLDAIFAALDDLSVHPDTARHLARKLVVHFVSDRPDPALVAHVAARWRETDGDLMQVYDALLEHPAAWGALGGKAKQPLDFIISAFRALGMTGADVMALPRQPFQEMVVNALAGMGQPFMRAPGPDGWKEADEAWITPIGLSQRIRWAMRNPSRLVKPLPDPRDFVVQALDDAATPQLIWAVGAADTVAQGVGLVLASTEFNRR